MKQKNTIKIKKADLVLIGIILGVALLFMLFYSIYYQGDGSWLVVYQDGVEMERYALEEDGVYVIDETNTFEIRQGIVNMIEADCENQICVNHISIENVGETIVCLPNKIVLAIEGVQEDNTLDAIVN